MFKDNTYISSQTTSQEQKLFPVVSGYLLCLKRKVHTFLFGLFLQLQIDLISRYYVVDADDVISGQEYFGQGTNTPKISGHSNMVWFHEEMVFQEILYKELLRALTQIIMAVDIPKEILN